MTTTRNYACICFDSSYVLAEIFENQDSRSRLGTVIEYQKKLNLDTYLPQTVEIECTNRMANIQSFVANIIRDFERYFRNKKSATLKPKEITFNDSLFVEEFFRIEQKKHKKGTSESEILRIVEALIVRYMYEKLHPISSKDYVELFTGMMVEILKYGNLLRTKFKDFKKNTRIITAVLDNTLLAKLQKDSILQNVAHKKPNDLKIICEVEAHQRKIHKWAILITLDLKDLLANSIHIDKLTTVKCVDPLYIPQIISKLSKMPVP